MLVGIFILDFLSQIYLDKKSEDVREEEHIIRWNQQTPFLTNIAVRQVKPWSWKAELISRVRELS